MEIGFGWDGNNNTFAVVKMHAQSPIVNEGDGWETKHDHVSGIVAEWQRRASGGGGRTFDLSQWEEILAARTLLIESGAPEDALAEIEQIRETAISRLTVGR